MKKCFIQWVGLIVILSSANYLNAQQNKDNESPQAAESIVKLPESLTSYYDFWIGEWDASWDEGDGKKGFGTNYIHPIMDGKALQENFKTIKGQNTGFDGISISIYDIRQEKWKQVWVDNQGNYLDLTGETSGNDRIFKTAVVKRNDKEIVQRMVFKNIKKDSFTWDWETSIDGGQNWNLSWRIYYTRKQKKNS